MTALALPDPVVLVEKDLYTLPTLDRLRLLGLLISDMDEDDSAKYVEFMNRTNGAGVSLRDRAGVYRVFGQEVPVPQPMRTLQGLDPDQVWD